MRIFCGFTDVLQVLDVNRVDVQLKEAVASYINSRVTLNQETGQVGDLSHYHCSWPTTTTCTAIYY